MATGDQIFANGRLAVMSTKLWGRDKFNRLAESVSTAECLRILTESGVGGGLTVTNPNDYELLLKAETDELLKLFAESCYDKHALKYFFAKFDYVNAKVLMKSKYMRTDGVPYCFTGATYDPAALQADFVMDEYGKCSAAMAYACREIDAHFADGERSPQIVDRILDNSMYCDMQVASICGKGVLLKKLFAWEVDTRNLMLVYRAKKANLDKEAFGGLIVRRGTISSKVLLDLYDGANPEILPEKYRKFYALCSNVTSLIEAEKAAKRGRDEIVKTYADALSLQPLVEYYYRKCDEIDNIRYVVIAVKNGVDSDKIKENIK